MERPSGRRDGERVGRVGEGAGRGVVRFQPAREGGGVGSSGGAHGVGPGATDDARGSARASGADEAAMTGAKKKHRSVDRGRDQISYY
eukprot:16909-Pelagococcus_subviridis.AAC.2